MNLSYSASKLTQSINQILTGERDMTNPVLDRYYPAEAKDETELAARYGESMAFRETVGLPSVPPSSFAVDTSTFGAALFFRRICVSAGIEEVFAEDMTARSRNTAVPTKLGAFIEKERKKLGQDTAAIASLLSFRPLSSSKHLTESLPYTVADEDKVIRQRTDKAYDYIREVAT